MQSNRELEKEGVKLTMLAFLIKACASALKEFPEFNASLDGDTLVLKHYFHIGFAADTPNGLVVPVIRDADRKGVRAARARERRAGCRGRATASSRRRTCRAARSRSPASAASAAPISRRSSTRPRWRFSACAVRRRGRCGTAARSQPRLMLPLSLSYDHRVIDGAAAARFTVHLSQLLADLRRAML